MRSGERYAQYAQARGNGSGLLDRGELARGFYGPWRDLAIDVLLQRDYEGGEQDGRGAVEQDFAAHVVEAFARLQGGKGKQEMAVERHSFDDGKRHDRGLLGLFAIHVVADRIDAL